MKIDRKLFMAGAACASAVLVNVAPASATSSTLTVTSVALNLREGPAKTYEILRVLPKGTKVEYLKAEGEWYQVKYESYIGYVKKDYVAVSSGSSLPISIPKAAKQNLNLRSGPGTSYGILAVVKKGDEVTYMGETGSWAYVSYNGIKGYVSKSYLTDINNDDKDDNTSSSSTTTKYVNVRALNVRSGPGSGYKLIGALYKGQKVEVYSVSNGWAKISYNGKTAYASNTYLVDADDYTDGSESTVVKYVNVRALNVRNGPGTEYSVIDGIFKGKKVTVMSVSGGWAKISYDGKVGYVSDSYLADSLGVDEDDINSSTVVKYVNISALNVRSGPSNSYTVIDGIFKGKKVVVMSVEGNWSKISYDGKVGYVYSSYLSDSLDEKEEENTTEKSTIKYVDVSSLNVRSGPGNSYSILGAVTQNTKLEVYSVTNGWAKIKYNGKDGYVYDDYLSDKESVSASSTKYVNISSLNVRKGPGTSYSAIGAVQYGMAVEVYSVTNGWAKIKFGSGVGYVSNVYLQDTKPSNVTQNNGSYSKDPQAVIEYAKTFLGIKYVWGGNTPSSGFDCSGFTSYVFLHKAGITIPRTSSIQSTYGKYVSKSDLKAGDLVFFDTNGINDGNVSHVGIYIGSGQMIHASYTQKKVVIADFNSSYFQRSYVNARRVL